MTAVNLGFTFVSVFHLAYLGIMFGGDTEAQEQVRGLPYLFIYCLFDCLFAELFRQVTTGIRESMRYSLVLMCYGKWYEPRGISCLSSVIVVMAI